MKGVAHGARDVARLAQALERGAGFDVAWVFLSGFGLSQFVAGRDRVDANRRRQFARQRLGQHRRPGLGCTIKRISFERPLGMNIDYVDDVALLGGVLRR